MPVGSRFTEPDGSRSFEFGEYKMSDYNGWTNRATWLINVWFEPESREQVQMARETF
jgi:hypothetical protein